MVQKSVAAQTLRIAVSGAAPFSVTVVADLVYQSMVKENKRPADFDSGVYINLKSDADFFETACKLEPGKYWISIANNSPDAAIFHLQCHSWQTHGEPFGELNAHAFASLGLNCLPGCFRRGDSTDAGKGGRAPADWADVLSFRDSWRLVSGFRFLTLWSCGSLHDFPDDGSTFGPIGVVHSFTQGD